MREFYFTDDISNFLISIGSHREDVLADMLNICRAGPQAIDACRDVKGGIWEYKRSIGHGRYAILLFCDEPQHDAYIGLHGFRSGPEGATRSDLGLARSRRKSNK